MLEALWTVEFVSNTGSYGAGVVVFKTGRIFGGDAFYYYLGNVVVKNEIVEAEVVVTHHSGPPQSIFGPLNKFHLKLSGKLQMPVMELHGYLVENPLMKMSARLTWRVELP
jgi:hypothetical protein